MCVCVCVFIYCNEHHLQQERKKLAKQRELERKRAEHQARLEWIRPQDDLLCDDLLVSRRALYSFLGGGGGPWPAVFSRKQGYSFFPNIKTI